MNRVQLSDTLNLSRIIHGHWRLTEWNVNGSALLGLTKQAIELGVTTFDHADIYGDYSCETLFGDALKLDPGVREEIEIITKTGIKLLSDKYPERRIKHYDYSFDHIIESVNNSLQNLGTDYIDLLLLHRPSPFFDPEDVARALSFLKQQGKVLNFGVSNFSPGQFELLQAHTDEPLVTNQIEISPYCLEHFDNGNIDFLQKENIKPMAWSPLAGGSLIHPQDEKGVRIVKELKNIAEELEVNTIDKVIYSWLLAHPAQILPIVGSGKIERLAVAIEARDIEMSTEQWFNIWTASTGHEVP